MSSGKCKLKQWDTATDLLEWLNPKPWQHQTLVRMWSDRYFHSLLAGMPMVQLLWFLRKLNSLLSYNPATVLLGIYPKELKTAAAAAKSLQSCPTLCDPIDGSPPGSLVPGILQARTLEWVAVSFSSAWKWKAKVKSLSRVWFWSGSNNKTELCAVRNPLELKKHRLKVNRWRKIYCVNSFYMYLVTMQNNHTHRKKKVTRTGFKPKLYQPRFIHLQKEMNNT